MYIISIMQHKYYKDIFLRTKIHINALITTLRPSTAAFSKSQLRVREKQEN